jgi:hypothetical protein
MKIRNGYPVMAIVRRHMGGKIFHQTHPLMLRHMRGGAPSRPKMEMEIVRRAPSVNFDRKHIDRDRIEQAMSRAFRSR